MNRYIKGLMVGCSLGVSILLAAPAWSVAASDAQGSPAPPAEPTASMPLEQLDEIVLEGRRLEQRLADSEARFYKRYSQLNSKDDFDVSCDFLWEDERIGSNLTGKRRSCVPVYYLKAIAMDAPLAPAVFSAPCGGSCMSGGSYNSGVGSPYTGNVSWQPGPGYFSDVFHRDNSYGSMAGSVASPALQRISPRANLVYLDRRADFIANLTRVVNSDPQLRGMARELDALALEGREAKQRAAEAGRLRRAEQKCTPLTSPRMVRFCRD